MRQKAITGWHSKAVLVTACAGLCRHVTAMTGLPAFPRPPRLHLPLVSELRFTPNRGFLSKTISARRWSSRASEGWCGLAVRQARRGHRSAGPRACPTVIDRPDRLEVDEERAIVGRHGGMSHPGAVCYPTSYGHQRRGQGDRRMEIARLTGCQPRV